MIAANGETLKDAADNNADLALNNVGDTSNIFISKGIAVTVPNGGEAWEAGSTQTIEWKYSGNPGSHVKIELLKNNIVNRVITSAAPIGSNGNGTYKWTISSNQAVGSDYKIWITSIDNNAYTDTSDGVFGIT
ncbi:MAG: GPI anchored serine-threonine rich family protein [Eubacteriales bacterium]